MLLPANGTRSYSVNLPFDPTLKLLMAGSDNGRRSTLGGSPPGTACSRIACPTDSHQATSAFCIVFRGRVVDNAL